MAAIATSFWARMALLPALTVMWGCDEIDAPADEQSDADADSTTDTGADAAGDADDATDADPMTDAGVPGGEDAPLSAEDSEWLSAHNSRRETYHAKYGGSYVPLKWSPALAASATSYAEYLAENDLWEHSNSDYGENLAWNGGSVHADISNVMTRWVEDEEATWGGHFTQVLWRATKYVGCGRASHSEHGSFQVCQYVTPGNCGGRSMELMMADTTGCLPACPPEGCF